MKTIIAEKPSVAREIARVVKATRREVGYLTGNGYNVTWAFGHLVQPALPDGYGIKGFHPDNLPIIPPVFKLIPRQVKSEKGYKPDSDAEAQIKVIARLFRESEKIIVATDAGREGELIFRYLYEYIGCATPFDRLWISSLTDTAIREGLERLESGSKYDNLYYAAKARSEADWLVGINATQAITVAAGRGTYSLGRVQTPTLAMVCERFWENRRFKPETLWQTHFSTAGGEDGEVVKFSSREKWKEKRPATEAYEALKGQGAAIITKVEGAAPAVRPDDAAKGGERQAWLHGGKDALHRAEALRGEADHLPPHGQPLHPRRCLRRDSGLAAHAQRQPDVGRTPRPRGRAYAPERGRGESDRPPRAAYDVHEA